MRVETIGNATLYLGDCIEILPTLPKVDAFVADPPYGVDGAVNSKTAGRGRKNRYGSFVDSPEYVATVAVRAVQMLVDSGTRGAVTPGNKCVTTYPPVRSFGAIYQPASVGLQAWGRADAQPILYYGNSPYGGKQLPSRVCSYVVTESSDVNSHPCPKPIGVWTRIVESVSKPGETVLDPFMGSGTTGVACANLGRKFIGIEIEPKYFEIAVERITNAQRQSRLFA